MADRRAEGARQGRPDQPLGEERDRRTACASPPPDENSLVWRAGGGQPVARGSLRNLWLSAERRRAGDESGGAPPPRRAIGGGRLLSTPARRQRGNMGTCLVSTSRVLSSLLGAAPARDWSCPATQKRLLLASGDERTLAVRGPASRSEADARLSSPTRATWRRNGPHWIAGHSYHGTCATRRPFFAVRRAPTRGRSSVPVIREAPRLSSPQGDGNMPT